MYLDGLNLTVSALALEDSPNAVSLGRLVLEHGYSFEWSPKLPRPVLRSPCGTPVELQVKGFVPYLPKQGSKISSKGKQVVEVKGKATGEKAVGEQAVPATEGGSSSSSSGSIAPTGASDIVVPPSIPSILLFPTSSRREFRPESNVCARWPRHWTTISATSQRTRTAISATGPISCKNGCSAESFGDLLMMEYDIWRG